MIRGFRVEVVDGSEPRAHDIDGGRCTIGSFESCSLPITDTTVSRFHCEIEIDDRGAHIRDLDSRNGTFVDGVRVVHALLKAGSLIRVGRTTLRFHFLGRRTPVPLSSRAGFGLLVGASVSMRALFARLEQVARSDSKVLLEGETGTGKSVTARSIHLESDRKAGPFIKVDCGAIPASLLESELFGHVKGSFTGAYADRVGAFEAADGGTLFLDEIGELPLELQPKLLDVLESHEIQRVGERKDRSRHVDVRIIAATNRDLRAEVNAGRFREDLYYRLAVAPIRLPSLRERAEDLPMLVETILARQRVSRERIAALVTDAFLDELRSAAWPGNIRQLINYLERCIVFESPQPLDALPVETDDGALHIPIDATLSFAQARDMAMGEVERFYFTELLRHHDDNVSRAARAAGIHRSYLYKKIQRYDIKFQIPDPDAPDQED